MTASRAVILFFGAHLVPFFIFKPFIHFLHGLFLQPFDDMRVSVHSDADSLVTQALLNYFRVYTCFQKHSGMGVP